ncbi:MAG: SAM-dependent DNA methyltransferase [Bacteriovoracaceae bacterium]|nr:SAM-dependent DNA methyltransferase [Bacteriovoracaceae bacterium]
MLAPELKSKIDNLWNKFWSGGIANPLTAMEQISYLLFMKRLDEEDLKRKGDAKFLKKDFKSIFTKENYRWSQFKQMEPEAMLAHVRDNVFPFIKNIQGDEGGVFARQMKDAVFIIPKPTLLVEAVEIIDSLKIMEQNQDTQGDIYEYLLSELQSSGKNGQFRTPRHIIKMMCAMINPKLGQTICDPSSGTGGFLIGAYQHILKSNTSEKMITVDEDGSEHGLVGDKIKDKKVWEYLRNSTFYGYDFDTTMLRIAAMNLVLHGIENPNIIYTDTLSKKFKDDGRFDIILANPPFKGSIDKGDISESLTKIVSTTKTELLFVVKMTQLLKVGGRCAVIVPDGVLFGSSNAHLAVRKKIIDDCQLEGVISMPSGVFKPYAGVSTAVLIFTKGGETDRVWFYDMLADGFSLDEKRDRIKDNDIPDIVDKWNQKAKLKTPSDGDKWFWVEKKEIVDNKYDLSINRYKKTIQKVTMFETPAEIIKEIKKLETEIVDGIEELEGMLL